MTDSPDFPGEGISYIGPAYGSNAHDPANQRMLIVIHCTANDATPTEEATYAKNRRDSSPTSAHFYAGDFSPALVQGLPLSRDAWHGASHVPNQHGYAVEVTGQAYWSRSTWTADMRDIQATAKAVRLMAQRSGIPLRVLTTEQLLYFKDHQTLTNGGVCTHAQCTTVFGGTHTDPGPGFPMDLVVSLAQTGGNGTMLSAQEYALLELASERVLVLVRMIANLHEVDDRKPSEPNLLRAYLMEMMSKLDTLVSRPVSSVQLSQADIDAIAGQVALSVQSSLTNLQTDLALVMDKLRATGVTLSQ